MTRFARFAVIGTTLALGSCGAEPTTTPPENTASAPAAPEAPAPAAENQAEAAAPAAVGNETASATPAFFAACAVCHTVTKDGPTRIGPNLWGVAGVAAASKTGFAYSPALKAAALTWDDATLDKWLTKPAALVPGTKMVFPGQPDAAKRKELIAYLGTLK